MKLFTFKNMIQILTRNRLPLSANLSPVDLITRMNTNYPAYGIDLDSINGVYIGENENYFFKDWFNRLYSRYSSFYCFAGIKNSDPYNEMSDGEWGMNFIYEVLKRYGDLFNEMNTKHNLFDIVSEDEKEKLLNPKYETNNSSVTVGGEFPTVIQENEVLDPANKEGTVNTLKITDEKDYLNRIFYILRNYPDFWTEFLNKFADLFTLFYTDEI